MVFAQDFKPLLGPSLKLEAALQQENTPQGEVTEPGWNWSGDRAIERRVESVHYSFPMKPMDPDGVHGWDQLDGGLGETEPTTSMHQETDPVRLSPMLSPYVSAYLQEFGKKESQKARGKLQRREHGAAAISDRGRGRQRNLSPEKYQGTFVAPFQNDGAQRFSEWPTAAHRSLSPARSNPARGQEGFDASASISSKKDSLRLPAEQGAASPRLELPSIKNDKTRGKRSRAERPKEQTAVPSTNSGRHSAPPGHVVHTQDATPADPSDSFLPVDLWNNVVARHVDLDPQPHLEMGYFNAMSRPFNRLKVRQYMKSTVRPLCKISKEPKGTHWSQPVVGRKPVYGAIFEEGREAASHAVRPEAPPSRLEASLLKEALAKMTENIKDENGTDPRFLARQAALQGKIEQVSSNLEPELYILDMITSELVKQTIVSCKERGGVLETIRLRFLDLFSTVTLALARACSDMDFIAEESEAVSRRMVPLKEENDELNVKVGQLEMENSRLKITIDELRSTLDTLRSSHDDSNCDDEGQNLQDSNATKLIKEANEMRDMLQSKLSVLNAQQRQQEANKDVLLLQVHELEERVRRDAERIEFLGQTVAQYKVRLAWMRVMAWAKRTKKPTAEAGTQDGQGLPDAGPHLSRVPSYAPSTRPGTSLSAFATGEEKVKNVITKETMQGNIIVFSGFWAGIVHQAEKMDFTLHPHLQMSRKDLLELIAKTYSEKILADEIDERSKLTKQTLPEFLYDYYLDLFGEPQLAEEALVIIVANVRTYDSTSARAWMFSRFLCLGGQPLPTEALSIYLASLVRIQNGQIPLLPSYDGVQVDAARALRVIEYIFMQVPYVQRAQVLHACEKLAAGLHIDIDALLLCLVEQWKEESGRAEERLRALFVASDVDGDGNLDFNEFTSIINHLRGGKGHREMLRMYAEMTLNKQVDCNTFVRVCRQYRFFTFEVGPVTRKADPAAKEIFETLEDEWGKFELTAMELLTIMAGTAAANRLEQLVLVFKKKMNEKSDPEETWHILRHIVEEMTAIVRKRAVEYPSFFQGMHLKNAKKD